MHPLRRDRSAQGSRGHDRTGSACTSAVFTPEPSRPSVPSPCVLSIPSPLHASSHSRAAPFPVLSLSILRPRSPACDSTEHGHLIRTGGRCCAQCEGRRGDLATRKPDVEEPSRRGRSFPLPSSPSTGRRTRSEGPAPTPPPRPVDVPSRPLGAPPHLAGSPPRPAERRQPVVRPGPRICRPSAPSRRRACRDGALSTVAARCGRGLSLQMMPLVAVPEPACGPLRPRPCRIVTYPRVTSMAWDVLSPEMPLRLSAPAGSRPSLLQQLATGSSEVPRFPHCGDPGRRGGAITDDAPRGAPHRRTRHHPHHPGPRTAQHLFCAVIP